jgi:hypothetical protein
MAWNSNGRGVRLRWFFSLKRVLLPQCTFESVGSNSAKFSVECMVENERPPLLLSGSQYRG